jgi:putative ABC transport system permease protein
MAMRDVLMRLIGTLRRDRGNEELHDEVEFHIDMQTEKNIRLGMPPADARRAAVIAFGGRERFKEEARDESRSRWLEDAAQDLRYGMRMLRRSPAFTTIAVLSLALGIGANTAVFSVVNAVILQPLPYAEPNRLVSITVKDDAKERSGVLSVADFRAVERDAKSFTAVGAIQHARSGITLTSGGTAEQLTGTFITSGVLPALGVQPLLGRGPMPAEDQAGGPRVVVLAHRFWRERFAESSAALGQTITLEGVPTTIVGVMPPGFFLPNMPDDQLWPVLQLSPPEWRAPFWLHVYGRLAPGSSFPQASAELQSLAASVKALYPQSPPYWTFLITDLKTTLVGDARTTVLMLYAAVALILLMASANVANLFLARATTRLPELAIRTALGAGRRRLMRQLITESLLTALLGGAFGLVLAYAGIGMLVAAMPGGMPHVREVAIDTWVLGFTAGIAILTGVAIGLVPALHIPHGTLGTQLRDGNRASTGSQRRRVAAALVVGEFALALTVLVGAGLAVNSLLRLQQVDEGVREEGVLVVRLAVPEARYDSAAKIDAFYDDAMRRVRALPGISSAAVSMAVPPHRLVMTNPYTPQGKVYAEGESAPVAEELLVSPDYFRTLDIPIRRGRAFTDADRDGAPGVTIINETMARLVFPGEEALGKWIQTGDPSPDSDKLTIVGVVPDVKYDGLDADPEPTIYVPYKQSLWWRSMYMVMRTSGDPLSYVPGVRAAITAIDPQIPLQEVQTMERLIGESVAEPRYRAALLGSFGVLALILASAGIYGVLSYTVNQRRRETGVRLALGATPGDVMSLVIRDGMRLAFIGVAFGIVLAVLSTRVLSTMLYEVSPLDPLTFGTMAVFLTLIGFAACAIPARRASRTDPMTAIRAE